MFNIKLYSQCRETLRLVNSPKGVPEESLSPSVAAWMQHVGAIRMDGFLKGTCETVDKERTDYFGNRLSQEIRQLVILVVTVATLIVSAIALLR